MVTWFIALKADGREDGMGCHCTTCAVTMFIFERPFAWSHCGRTERYVAPATRWERLTTAKLERRVSCQPTQPALTVLQGGWDGTTLGEEDPTEGLIAGPTFG